jgi:hypothetical protein
MPSRPAVIYLNVAPLGPAQAGKRLAERGDTRRHFRVFLGETAKHADTPHPLVLLCPRNRGQYRCPAEQLDEVASPRHSITSLAHSAAIVPAQLAQPLHQSRDALAVAGR